MNSTGCACQGEDCAAAWQAVRRAEHVDRLVDESHFIASTLRCAGCGQLFIKLFCECVDWADGDDPQEWTVAPISEDEAKALREATIATDEDVICRIVSGERRFLHRRMPKSVPETIEWKRGAFFVPAHD